MFSPQAKRADPLGQIGPDNLAYPPEQLTGIGYLSRFCSSVTRSGKGIRIGVWNV